MMQWLRLYHDTAHDPKWRTVAVESGHPVATILGVWSYMLIHASQANPRGTLEGWNDRIAGAALDLKADQIAAIRQAMQGIVLADLILTGWDRRQRTSDDAAERQRKTRARRQDTNPPDGDGHGTDRDSARHNGRVTEQTMDVTRHSDHVTRQSHDVAEISLRAQTTDSDTEEESKKESPPTPPPGDGGGLFSQDIWALPEEASDAAEMPEPTVDPNEAAFERFKAVYPRRNHPHTWGGKTGGKSRFLKHVKAGVDPEMIIGAAIRYAAAMEAERKVKTSLVADALTWLNQERWIEWNNVHQFPNQNDEAKSKGDKSHPPTGYDDVPRGTRIGWWTRVSTGWQRMAG